MTSRTFIMLLSVMFGMFIGGRLVVAQTPLTLEDRVAGLETRVTTLEGHLTATVVPSATSTSSATPVSSPVPPTGTPTVAAGWHPPTTHEHGDAPPAWVLASANPPFSQSRESHVGYKGALAVSPGGVASYLIVHILSTVAARAHGDHDFEMWLLDPETREVFYVSGILDFGNPPPLRLRDTGERPIILSADDGPCETWYSRPGSPPAPDIGWTVCGRYAAFSGEVRGGLGTFRGADWIIPCRRLPAGHPLADNCRDEFGVPRLSWLRASHDYRAPGIIAPN